MFETEKIIIIKRTTDKILKIVEKIIDRKVDDTIVVFNSDNLEKKSKLRLFFEKDKKCSCTPFYPDDEKTLSKFAHNILKEKKIPMSYENINIIINRCDGDRQILKNELEKIEFYCKNGKTINFEKISKLVNLIENYSVSELVDNCLAKNKKKIINIFNENNFSNEECILITRTLLNKSKKILKLSNEYENNKDINLTISSAKPPIFWKDKEITKQQIYKWNPQNIKKLIYKINELELLIKNNISDPINLVTDFILSQSSVKN